MYVSWTFCHMPRMLSDWTNWTTGLNLDGLYCRNHKAERLVVAECPPARLAKLRS